ncbi:MAG: hypothetical protein V7782_04305 [Psychromonas sp.]
MKVKVLLIIATLAASACSVKDSDQNCDDSRANTLEKTDKVEPCRRDPRNVEDNFFLREKEESAEHQYREDRIIEEAIIEAIIEEELEEPIPELY